MMLKRFSAAIRSEAWRHEPFIWCPPLCGHVSHSVCRIVGQSSNQLQQSTINEEPVLKLLMPAILMPTGESRISRQPRAMGNM